MCFHKYDIVDFGDSIRHTETFSCNTRENPVVDTLETISKTIPLLPAKNPEMKRNAENRDKKWHNIGCHGTKLQTVNKKTHAIIIHELIAW